MRASVQETVRRMLWDKVPRDHRQEQGAFRRRQVVTAVVVVVGAVVLGWSLRIEPGQQLFLVATLVLAGVWTLGAFVSGPLYLGRVAGENRLRRPVSGPIALGVALAGVFVLGALLVRQVPFLDEQVRSVLGHADQGVTPVLLLVTLVNGIAEELFFRGAAYAAIPRHPVSVTTAAYVVATLATGNVMLAFAAVLLGLVVGLERRASGGVLAPVLTHLTWSVIMLSTLPLLF